MEKETEDKRKFYVNTYDAAIEKFMVATIAILERESDAINAMNALREARLEFAKLIVREEK